LEAAKIKEDLKGLLDDDDESAIVRRVWDLPVLAMAGVFVAWAAAIGYVYLWTRLNAADLHRSKLEVSH
jgi:hypothetical protein